MLSSSRGLYIGLILRVVSSPRYISLIRASPTSGFSHSVSIFLCCSHIGDGYLWLQFHCAFSQSDVSFVKKTHLGLGLLCRMDHRWVYIHLVTVTLKATKYRGVVTGATVLHLGGPGFESRSGDISFLFVFSQFLLADSLIYIGRCLRHW
jgi:hypothetical protein